MVITQQTTIMIGVLTIDYFLYEPTPSLASGAELQYMIEERDSSFDYSGGWEQINVNTFTDSSAVSSSVAGSSFEFDFHGKSP